MQIPSWLTSKFFWIHFLLIMAQLIAYLVDNDLFIGKWVALFAGIQIIIGYILNVLQENQVKTLKLKMAKIQRDYNIPK
jgi:hypothetical protein